MQTTPFIDFRQRRTFSEVISVTTLFIRQNFRLLLKSLLVMVMPFLVFTGAFSLLVLTETLHLIPGSEFPVNTTTATSSVTNVLLYTGIILLSTIMAVLAQYGTVFAFLSLYTEHNGQAFGLSDIWEKFKNSIPVLLSTAFAVFFIALLLYLAVLFISSVLIYFLLTDAGLFVALLFAVPLMAALIYCSTLVALLFAVRLQERASFGDGVIRSFSLLRGAWWQTAGVFFILLLVAFILNYVIFIPAILLTGGVPSFFPFASTDTYMSEGTIIISALSSVVRVLLYTLPLTGIVIQYYNLVERKEAAGLRERINDISFSDDLPDTDGLQQ